MPFIKPPFEVFRRAVVPFLEKWTDPGVVARGRTCETRVADVRRAPDGTVVATVRGREDYVTTLRVDESGRLRAGCSCPVGYRCKHAVALALRCARIAREGGSPRPPDPGDPRGLPPPDIADVPDPLDDGNDPPLDEGAAVAAAQSAGEPPALPAEPPAGKASLPAEFATLSEGALAVLVVVADVPEPILRGEAIRTAAGFLDSRSAPLTRAKNGTKELRDRHFAEFGFVYPESTRIRWSPRFDIGVRRRLLEWADARDWRFDWHPQSPPRRFGLEAGVAVSRLFRERFADLDAFENAAARCRAGTIDESEVLAAVSRHPDLPDRHDSEARGKRNWLVAALLQDVADRAWPAPADVHSAPVAPPLRALMLPLLVHRALLLGVPPAGRLAEYAAALEERGARRERAPFADSILFALGAAGWAGRPDLADRIGAAAAAFEGEHPADLRAWRNAAAVAKELPSGAPPDSLAKAANAFFVRDEGPRPDDPAGVPANAFTHLRLPAVALAMATHVAAPLATSHAEAFRKRFLEISPRRGTEHDLFAALLLLSEERDPAFRVPEGGHGAPDPGEPPVLSAVRAFLLQARDPEHRQKPSPRIAASLAPAASLALDVGLPFAGATIAGLVRWAEPATEEADAALARAAALGVRPPLATEAPKPLWEEGLEALEKTFGTAAPAPDGGVGTEADVRREWRVEWKLRLAPAGGRGPDAGSLFVLRDVDALLRGRLRSGGWNAGRSIRPYGLARVLARLDPPYVPERPDDPVDAPFLDGRSPGFVELRYGESTADPDVASLLHALCGTSRAMVLLPHVHRSGSARLKESSLGAAVGRDPATGALEIRPEWMPDEKDEDPFRFSDDSAPEDRIFFRRRKEADVWDVCFPSPFYRRLLAVVRKNGKNGVLRIPASAAQRAAFVLAALEKRIPVFGNRAETNAQFLPRLAGDPAPHARLAFRGGALEVALRVRPDPARALRLVPGAGGAEELLPPVEGGPGAARLVRDLAREDALAAPARAALAPWPDAAADRNFWRFESLAEALEALEALHGVEPALPLEWIEGSHPVEVSAVRGVRVEAREGADRWFEVSGDLDLDGGRVVSFLDLLSRLPERVGRYVPLGEGRYLRLADSLRRRLDALAAAGAPRKGALRLSPAAIPALARLDEEEGAGQPAFCPDLREAAARFRAALAAPVAVPEGLRATLRPYQAEGFAWLSRLARCGLGACLADDMGLGKTVQLLALLLERAAAGPSLVVAPASVVGNWEAETHRFAPALRPVVAAEAEDGASAGAGPGDVVLVSYGLLVSRLERFASREWNVLVLDEAQAVKNPATKRARDVKTLRAAVRVAATGTPVENSLTEFWSLFDFLDPGLLGSHDAFRSRFVEGGRAAPALKRLVAPLLLRRLKREVLADLPDKTEIALPVALGPEEASAYEALRVRALARARAAAAGGPGGAPAGGRIGILAELTRLRRFCCHPSLSVPDWSGGSAKFAALRELLSDLREAGHKALVFSQFTDCLALVRELVEKEGWTYRYLDGAVPAAERTRRVAEFQDDPSVGLFLISLKAGGTGLNLTAASYVVLLDPWWNPAVEDQAADRAHRIGQRNPVTVYRLVDRGTVEEKVLALHEEKRALSEDLLSAAGSAALDPASLLALFER